MSNHLLIQFDQVWKEYFITKPIFLYLLKLYYVCKTRFDLILGIIKIVWCYILEGKKERNIATICTNNRMTSSAINDKLHEL